MHLIKLYTTYNYNTCKEINIVKIHANAADSLFTARTPNTHVVPSSGSNISVAFNHALCMTQQNWINIFCSWLTHYFASAGLDAYFLVSLFFLVVRIAQRARIINPRLTCKSNKTNHMHVM